MPMVLGFAGAGVVRHILLGCVDSLVITSLDL